MDPEAPRIILQPYDVICHPRNRDEADFIGNKRFAVTVFLIIDGNPHAILSPDQRQAAIESIVTTVEQTDPVGRFLVETDVVRAREEAAAAIPPEEPMRELDLVEWRVLTHDEAVRWVDQFIDRVVPQPRPAAPEPQAEPDNHPTSQSSNRRSASGETIEEMLRSNPRLAGILQVQSAIFNELVAENENPDNNAS
mmetsp:Transcript_23273/g.39515  ORF Transcript_23273/g.39515 Transcript_23273/m.39515 type:complete len:195 (-) Transcript_23273:243-827(-)|eukprot:CAMPEP_0116540612 /NCGR_PEP_ID=MMETSP0397-20121206/45_1 /TAXON_ID=216820 /ORGANISM="Cyclophora tenuis, Strain ECT3854" /LENGTH=194 /DNA_ID=CAMNT_0004064505 /DNA_START=295 /DNA_END=879 /DNA_ORIENTATION=-